MIKFTNKSFGMNSRQIQRRLEGEGYNVISAAGDGYIWMLNGTVIFDGSGMTMAQATYNAWNETSTPKLKK